MKAPEKKEELLIYNFQRYLPFAEEIWKRAEEKTAEWYDTASSAQERALLEQHVYYLASGRFHLTTGWFFDRLQVEQSGVEKWYLQVIQDVWKEREKEMPEDFQKLCCDYLLWVLKGILKKGREQSDGLPAVYEASAPLGMRLRSFAQKLQEMVPGMVRRLAGYEETGCCYAKYPEGFCHNWKLMEHWLLLWKDTPAEERFFQGGFFHALCVTMDRKQMVEERVLYFFEGYTAGQKVWEKKTGLYLMEILLRDYRIPSVEEEDDVTGQLLWQCKEIAGRMAQRGVDFLPLMIPFAAEMLRHGYMDDMVQEVWEMVFWDIQGGKGELTAKELEYFIPWSHHSYDSRLQPKASRAQCGADRLLMWILDNVEITGKMPGIWGLENLLHLFQVLREEDLLKLREMTDWPAAELQEVYKRLRLSREKEHLAKLPLLVQWLWEG